MIYAIAPVPPTEPGGLAFCKPPGDSPARAAAGSGCGRRSEAGKQRLRDRTVPPGPGDGGLESIVKIATRAQKVDPCKHRIGEARSMEHECHVGAGHVEPGKPAVDPLCRVERLQRLFGLVC